MNRALAAPGFLLAFSNLTFWDRRAILCALWILIEGSLMSKDAAINTPLDDAVRQSHPAGLYTLFFTELWERMSYYGMRALLVLFMVAAVEEGGLGFTEKNAAAIYGIYSAAVYLLALPGGWIADRLLGQQNAVWYGGIIIAAGHFAMALPLFAPVSDQAAFFTGLVLIVVGTGLLKPNISTIVGELYPEGGARQDAGFTIFYMGINLGAFAGPLISGWLGENIDWHYGFGAAGVGMVIGLIQYRIMRPKLGEAGLYPHAAGLSPAAVRMSWAGIGAFCVLLTVLLVLGLTETVHYPAVALAHGTKYFIITIAAIFFGYVLFFGGLDADEKKRVLVIAALFVGAAMFWAGFEQAGTSLNLFAERYTERVMGSFTIPASWFQSLNPFFIVTLAPLFAWAWVQLARRHLEPSTPFKFALGFFLLAGGFLVMVFAAKLVSSGEKALPFWLILTYLLHTTGELCLSPVGLSSVTKLSPRRYTSQMMGTWFMGSALGSVMAGLIAGDFDEHNVQQMPDLFMSIVTTSVGMGIVFVVLTPALKRWSRGCE